MNVGCDVRLHGRYDIGDDRSIYVMLPLRSEDEWLLYKSCASESGLNGAEVVAEITLLPSGEITVHEMDVMTEEIIVDPIAVEQVSQEELHGATHRASLGSELAKTNSEALNLTVVTDEFDDKAFDENVDTEAHVEGEDEAGISESDKENMQPTWYHNLQKSYHMTFVNNNELRTLHMSYENACNNFINLSYDK
jgi:hypothetical protein